MKTPGNTSSEIANELLEAAAALKHAVNTLSFASPTERVYNPLDYAWEPYVDYVNKYATGPVDVVFMGMNPGPWGMAQVGIPFGEIDTVKDWLHVDGIVGKPSVEHPKRPVQGFACEKSEVSGRRLWGLFRERFMDANVFFKQHFVINYCPLVFMESTGRNRTPDKLSAEERAPLYAACDAHLRSVVVALRPKWVIGVGKFAATRASEVFGDMDIKIDWILHPSPASPAANRDWAGYATKKLLDIGVWS